jgi:hypothetical protein
MTTERTFAMSVKKTVRNTAYCAVISSLICVVLIIGGLIESLDLLCASAAAIVIHVVFSEKGTRNALMIFAVSALLSNILLPLRTCPMYFLFFFGYYPVMRGFLHGKIKSRLFAFLVLALIYNAVMLFLFTVFKTVFGMANEPVYMFILLFICANLFFFSFDLLTDRIMIIYNHKIKKLFDKTSNKK